MNYPAWQPTAIEGVLRTRVEMHPDPRGEFGELWRASWTAELGEDAFVQANLSRSRAGVLRGMHFHRRQADLWLLVEGTAVAATTDLRGLARDGLAGVRSQVLRLEAGDGLYLPRLVAHGFWALSDIVLVYVVSNEYDGSDEHGFAWHDPDAGIAWPAGEPVVSERDAANPRLAELQAELAQHS